MYLGDGKLINYPSADCVYNFDVAVRNRVVNQTLKPTEITKIPSITVKMYKRVRAELRYLLKELPPVKSCSWEEVLEKYVPKSKRKYYRRRMAKIFSQFNVNAKTKMFTKTEKTELDVYGSKVYTTNYGDLGADPRAVTPMSMDYNVAISKFIGPLQETVFNYESQGIRFPKGKIFAKGLDDVSLYNLLHEKWNGLGGDGKTRALIFDVSRWDRHIRGALKKLEEEFMIQAFDGDTEFSKLIKMFSRNKGVAKSNLFDYKYDLEACRASGSSWTSLMNHVLMTCVMNSFMKYLGLTVYDIVDAGDDIIVLVNDDDALKVERQVDSYFKQCGLSIKVETIAHSFEDIKFCQKRPFAGSMVRSFQRIASRAMVCPGNYLYDMPTYLRSVFECELHLNHKVPITGHLCKLMHEKALKAGGKFNQQVFDNYKKEQMIALRVNKIPEYIPERDHYSRVTGISPEMQLVNEDIITKFVEQIDLSVSETVRKKWKPCRLMDEGQMETARIRLFSPIESFL